MHKVVFFLAVFLLALCFIIGVYTYFRVNEINVEGAKELSGLDLYSHASIFFLNPEKIEKNIAEQNPTIREVHVAVQYPQTLNVSVVEAAPIAQLVLEDGFMSLSSGGKILNKQKDPIDNVLIHISYYQPLYFRNFTVGDVVDIKEIVDTVFFIEEGQKLDLPISTVDIRNENMIVLFSEEREILVSATKDSRVQIAQLKVVLEQVRAKALAFSKLDLRFEKPIIVFKK
jgi:hypothetical protein